MANEKNRGRQAGNGSSNGQNDTTGDGGERRNGRLAQIKNHSTTGVGPLDEYVSGNDKYEE
ncbi:hypothetical protein [Paenibacillus macerans]|uniref:hypothetical protein n=1 Tax=Paenibacillus macerans TaxID=44252 RepID=UPI002040D49A|nr:hypothetical protein [Paenibacillus macerans]MCM3700874.1 hypothetical protein [Paenibacillus macerans]